MHSGPALLQTPPSPLNHWGCACFLRAGTVVSCLVNCQSAFLLQLKYPLGGSLHSPPRVHFPVPPPARGPATKKGLPPECATGFPATVLLRGHSLPTSRTASSSSSWPLVTFPIVQTASTAGLGWVFSGPQTHSDWLLPQLWEDGPSASPQRPLPSLCTPSSC